ncbi:MAG: hypothetical protein ACK5MU_02070 [Candidatus Saccharimonadales bacterium]
MEKDFICYPAVIDEDANYANFVYVGKLKRKKFRGFLDGFFIGTITETKDSKITEVTYVDEGNGEWPAANTEVDGSIDGEFAGIIRLSGILSTKPEMYYTDTFTFLVNAKMRMQPIEQYGFSEETTAWLKSANILLLDDIICAEEEQRFDEVFVDPAADREVKAKLTEMGYYGKDDE